MEFIAKSSTKNESSRKMRVVIAKVKKMPLEKALAFLSLWPKRASVPIRATLVSAIANAKDRSKLDISQLRIKEIQATAGPTLKRFKFRARGQADKMNKRTVKIRVILEDKKG